MAPASLAATLICAVVLYGIFTGTPEAPTSSELAAAVVDHWHEDAAARNATNGQVDAHELREALAGQARIDPVRIGTISYANSCEVLGQRVPHLSIRGSAGTVMVVLLPGYRLEEPVPFQLASRGLRGRILPAGRGSIALLADGLEPLEPLEHDLLAAIDWPA